MSYPGKITLNSFPCPFICSVRVHSLCQTMPFYNKNSRKCLDSVENFPNLIFSKKGFGFLPQKFLMTFFSHRLQMLNYFPLFSLFHYISPLFRENYYSPCLCKFSFSFRTIYVFLHTFCVFRFPLVLTMMHLCIAQCTHWTPLV